jgi:hypothetical protein
MVGLTRCFSGWFQRMGMQLKDKKQIVEDLNTFLLVVRDFSYVDVIVWK